MKIIYASEHSRDDINAFSGIPFHMSRAFDEAVDHIEYIQTPLYDLNLVKSKDKKGIEELKNIGQLLSQILENKDADAVVCQGSSMIPFLKTDKLVILWHDSTWLGLTNMDFQDFKMTYPTLYEWDYRVLERCDVICFAAEWLRDQTLTYYDISPKKVHVIPFGANLTPTLGEDVDKLIKQRSNSRCQVTFLGVNWQRKGLMLAYEVMIGLRAQGIPTTMNVIGCEVPTDFPSDFHEDEDVRNYGFLSKDRSSQRALLQEILRNSHFLLHPANFECFGIALAEANAFGVPAIATNNHGPKTIIRDGYNGKLFERSEYVAKAVDFIKYQMEEYEDYRKLASTAFLYQRNYLNWSTGVQRIKAIAKNLF
jgi:glycosyltransferase involved in cell wall biosynthesis